MALEPALLELKTKLHAALLDRLSGAADEVDPETVRREATALVEEWPRTAALAAGDRRRLVDSLLDDVTGLGILEPLLRDPAVSGVMVNSPDRVFAERGGQFLLTDLRFGRPEALMRVVQRDGRVLVAELPIGGDEELMRVIERLAAETGHRFDRSSPVFDAGLPDGSRVNVILPPLAVGGPVLTIRKAASDPAGAEDLTRGGFASAELMHFLAAAVRARLSIAVSGGPRSGKTTLLRVLAGFIPDQERVITIEDLPELRLRLANVVALQAPSPSSAEAGRELIQEALRMRPDRVLVGDLHGGETLDLLQAAGSGQAGSMATVTAASPAGAIARLETMAMLADREVPGIAVRSLIASAIDLVAHVARGAGGVPRLISVSEPAVALNARIKLDEVFGWRPSGEGSAVAGAHAPAPRVPRCLNRMRARGEAVDPALFGGQGGDR